jgi:hypothetical protein
MAFITVLSWTKNNCVSCLTITYLGSLGCSRALGPKGTRPVQLCDCCLKLGQCKCILTERAVFFCYWPQPTYSFFHTLLDICCKYFLSINYNSEQLTWVRVPMRPLCPSLTFESIVRKHPCGVMSTRRFGSVWHQFTAVFQKSFIALVTGCIFFLKWNEGQSSSRLCHKTFLCVDTDFVKQ